MNWPDSSRVAEGITATAKGLSYPVTCAPCDKEYLLRKFDRPRCTHSPAHPSRRFWCTNRPRGPGRRTEMAPEATSLAGSLSRQGISPSVASRHRLKRVRPEACNRICDACMDLHFGAEASQRRIASQGRQASNDGFPSAPRQRLEPLGDSQCLAQSLFPYPTLTTSGRRWCENGNWIGLSLCLVCLPVCAPRLVSDSIPSHPIASHPTASVARVKTQGTTCTPPCRLTWRSRVSARLLIITSGTRRNCIPTLYST